MAREITEVWIYVSPLAPHNVCVKAEPFAGLPESFQQHVTRVPLLTPHDAAVLEAAEAERDAMAVLLLDLGDYKAEKAWSAAHDRYVNAVTARRAANAGGEP